MTIDPARLLQLFGRLHILILHLPIGLLAGLAVLEAVALWRKSFDMRGAAKLLAWVTALTAALAAGSGYVLSLEDASRGQTLQWHMYLGISLAVACLLTAIAAVATKQVVVYRVLLLIALGLMVPTGHLGGSMTHGSSFLTAPLTVQDEPSDERGDDAEALDATFANVVLPILKDKCSFCHGDSRQKADLRLHTPEGLLAGGKHGAVFVPANPGESEIVRRIKLPLEHDHHMPPGEKPQLTEDEIQAIEDWIRQGGRVYSDQRETTDRQPEYPRPDPDAVAALEDLLVHVEAVEEGSHLLVVDFSPAGRKTDDATARNLLEPLLEHLDALSFAACPVGDDVLFALQGAANLRRLDLRSTQVTDTGLATITGLAKLEELVLIQTQLTDDAVEHLIAMPALKRAYVWGTGLSEEAIARLRQERSEVRIEAGDAPEAEADEVEPDLVFTGDRPLPGEEPPAVALKPVNTTCPVSGGPVDPAFVILYRNRLIGFCCQNCPTQFWADPAKFEAKLPSADAPDGATAERAQPQ